MRVLLQGHGRIKIGLVFAWSQEQVVRRGRRANTWRSKSLVVALPAVKGFFHTYFDTQQSMWTVDLSSKYTFKIKNNTQERSTNTRSSNSGQAEHRRHVATLCQQKKWYLFFIVMLFNPLKSIQGETATSILPTKEKVCIYQGGGSDDAHC